MMPQAIDVAADVRSGRVMAQQVVSHALAGLSALVPDAGAVTRLLEDRAYREAEVVDKKIAAGKDPGPLAGVPYGVKDLFDIVGLPNSAGSRLYEAAPAALEDAEAIKRLKGAGGILCATLNMDEFAYGFATVNARHGVARNPHDTDRLAGGSSGGSAVVVASGVLPFSLGSDTNGSIRVPASLTGVYGLKPTHGGLPMKGVFPFAESFDDVGSFAISAADMKCQWSVLSARSEIATDQLIAPRVAILGGRFLNNVDPDQLEAMRLIAANAPIIELPDVAQARSAAFLMTAYEGGTFHREALGRQPMMFDPAVRDRLIAGALIPKSLYERARAFRLQFREQVAALFAETDILLAPSTPCVAPLIDDPHIWIDGGLTPARADLGIHTQPISFAGLPALSVPLYRPGRLPLGLQLIGRPNSEPLLFDFAEKLERAGIIGVSPVLGAKEGDYIA
jgi:aspartyl-tRNA(Asn)/glutamyl-tRNA(Gln) amidotransferase subunit A